MVRALEDDLKSIAEWAEAAARHHGGGAHREALMHGRMVGEAAARAIIRVAWPGKRGEEAVAASSFDLLLRTIQGMALAPPEIISALHVLRTRGNKATHGRPVSANDSAGALFMLQALVEHVHGTLLQLRFPEGAMRAMEQALGGRSEPERKEVLREVLREEARDEQQRQAPAPALDPADVRRIEAEQDDHRARIRDMEELVKLLAAREAQAPTPVAEPLPADPVPARRARWPIAAALVLVAVVAALWLVNAPMKSAQDLAAIIEADSTTTTVLILPFALMQDDPNLNLRFEQAILERLNARIRERKLGMRAFLADTALSTAPSDDGALAIARRHHADVIFFGELFEPTSTDSGRARIRFISPGEGNWPKGDLGALGFRSLADSGATRIQLAVQGIAELALAQRLYAADQSSAALAVLYETPAVSTDWTVTAHIMRARCHRYQRDLAPAMRETEAALALAPENASTLAFMGRVLRENGNHAAAIGYYEMAVAREPRNAAWIMALAQLVGDRQWPEHFDSARARELCMRALEADSTHAGAWDLQGQIRASNGDYSGARAAFERAIALDSLYPGALYDLATLLLQHQRPPDETRAEALLRRAVRLDSAYTSALHLLAQLLSRGANKDAVLADRLYRKANAVDPRLELKALAGRAGAAYEARNDRLALELYQQLWAKDSSDLSVGVRIAVLLQQLGQEPASLAMLLRCHALDSMHHGVNLNLGITYLEPGTAPERQKSIKHLERALVTDPLSRYALERLGMALTEDGQYVRAKPILERLLRIAPKSHVGNGCMGTIMMQLGSAREAIAYFESAMLSDAEDPVVCGNLAALYLALRPPRTADARVLLQSALRQMPHDPSLHLSMHSVLMKEGDFRGAADHYRRALEIKPSLRSASIEKKLAEQGQW